MSLQVLCPPCVSQTGRGTGAWSRCLLAGVSFWGLECLLLVLLS